MSIRCPSLQVLPAILVGFILASCDAPHPARDATVSNAEPKKDAKPQSEATGSDEARLEPVLRTPVEVWLGQPDIIVSMRFRDGFQEALRRSPDYYVYGPSSRRKPGTMIITIPGVDRQAVQGRWRLTYKMEFERVNQSGSSVQLNSAGGECWEDEMRECVAQAFARTNLVNRAEFVRTPVK